MFYTLYLLKIISPIQILRDLFHYKPPITKEQFFNSGFVERKIIMCTDVLKLVQQKNKSLQPPKKAPTTTTSSLGQVVSLRVGSGDRTMDHCHNRNHLLFGKISY
jgi:hypothetical protein